MLLAWEFTLVGVAAVISALGSFLSAFAAYRIAMRKDSGTARDEEPEDDPPA